MTSVDRRLTIGRMAQRSHAIGLCAAMLACALIATACERKPSPTTAPAADSLRIVSLSPAISRTLIDLDLDGHIVGRTPFCTSIDQSIPVVGDLTNVDYELLVRLEPTVILVQPPAGGVDKALVELAAERRWRIGAWRLNGLDDLRTLLSELPMVVYPDDSAAATGLRAKSTAVMNRLDVVLGSTANVASPIWPHGRVLMVNAVDPVMAFGSNTYLDDMLQALGAQNAVRDRGWAQLSLEDVVRLEPDAIVLVKPGASQSDLLRDLGSLATMDVPAVKANRLALLSHPDSLMPSSGVVGVAAELRDILQRFAENSAAAENRP